jgi:hypothetical protein
LTHSSRILFLAQDEVTLANESPATIAKILVDLGDRFAWGWSRAEADRRPEVS